MFELTLLTQGCLCCCTTFQQCVRMRVVAAAAWAMHASDGPNARPACAQGMRSCVLQRFEKVFLFCV